MARGPATILGTARRLDLTGIAVPALVDGRTCASPASAQRLQDADVARHARPTHVVDPAQLRSFHLHPAGLAADLHGGEDVHRHPGGADRVALGLEAARGI